MNTILWGNSAQTGKEIWIGDSSYPSTLTISYSDVEGGQASCYVDSGCTLNWGAGMIDAAPLFVDLTICDLHLSWDSPCKDTGDNLAANLPAVDFEGDPRIAYGTVDIGADEFHRHLYYTGNATPGGSLEMKFVSEPGTAQVGLIIGFSVFDPPLPSAWGDWYIKPPPMIIIPGLGPIPSNGVYVLPGTLPPTPAGPYTAYFQAMIGMKLSNLCTMNVE